MTWTKDKDGGFFTQKDFNGITYRLGVYPYTFSKSVYLYISLSSGKKRKVLETYMPRDYKTGNGIKPLLWAKEVLLTLNHDIFIKYNSDKKKKRYICIQWADNRRRNIYSRLIKNGFQFRMIHGEKVLLKKLK